MILSYNYGHTIGRAIQSALDQTYENLEIVIVDDFSSDNSIEVINSYKDSRIKLVKNRSNLGGSASFNEGLRHCNGVYIANLDADDKHESIKTTESIDFFFNNPDVSIVGTWLAANSIHGGLHPTYREVERITNTRTDLNLISSWVGKNLLSRSSTIVKKSVYESIGGSDPFMTFAPDYELWTRALSAGYRFGVIPKKLTNQSIHGKRVTHSNPSATFLEMAYTAGRNLSPLAMARGQHTDLRNIISWATDSEILMSLSPNKANVTIANLVTNSEHSNYKEFLEMLEANPPKLNRLGVHLRNKSQPIHNWPESPRVVMAPLKEARVEVDKIAVLANELIVNLPESRPVRKIFNLLQSRKYVAATLIVYGYILLQMQASRRKSLKNSRRLPDPHIPNQDLRK